MCVKASLEREDSVLRPSIRRQCEGADLAALFEAERPDLTDQDVSVVAGHPDIADEHIRPPASQHVECFVGGRRHGDVRSGLPENLREEVPRIGVVVHDQDPSAGEVDQTGGRGVESPIGGGRFLSRGDILRERELDHQRGSSAFPVALGPHGAFMEFHDMADDREAEPQAAMLSRPLILSEAVEDVREKLRADAPTGVADREACVRAGPF